MQKGVILQARDFEILRSVYEYTVTSFEQLKAKHFAHTNVQTASNRLNRLVKANYLKSYRVGLVIYQGKERQVNKIFALTSLGLQALSLKLKNEVQRTEPLYPQFYSLVHDLLLNEVMDALKKENTDRSVVNAKLLKIVRSRTEQIPDLVMEGESREMNEAVELELTAKSEKRYREMITNYRLSSRWRKIVFIVQDDSVKEKLWRVIAGERSFSKNENDHFGKFYFRNLDELLTPPVAERRIA